MAYLANPLVRELEYHDDQVKASSLLFEVNTVYARLLKAEATCTQIGQGQSENSESNRDLNREQWEALHAIHRTFLHEHNQLPIVFSTLYLELRHLKKIAHDISLHWCSLLRFRDSLVTLIGREKDLESVTHWLEVMSLCHSLIDILWHQEMALMYMINGIEAILDGVEAWFKCRFEDLSRKKDVTEEQCLAEPIFEFPNNIRHSCTTMPRTILPALLILWGVCWMFIIGSSQPEYEWGNATDPINSPIPAAHDLYTDFYGIGIEGEPEGSVTDDPDNRGLLSHDTLNELFPGVVHLMDDLIHPLDFAQDTPQYPNFLIPDISSRGDHESLEVAAQDTAEILPTAAIEESTLTAGINAENSGERDATGNADSSGYGHPTINSDDKGEETKAHFVCPDCQRTFARPYTLSRHRTEIHHAPSLEESLLCPNTGCKRSKGKPFKRNFHRKRHLESCKHNQEDLSRHNDQSFPRSASTSTSASASIRHHEEFRPDEAIRANGMRKRPRAEDDEESNDKFLLAEMVKKYKKMEQEIKEKQDGLKALEKTIQILKGSLRNS